MPRDGPHEKALRYLEVAHLYRLGSLRTERPHPRTRELSRWSRTDLPRALSVLGSIDAAALAGLQARSRDIDRLARRIDRTLEKGRRIFLCGCGATGRLALCLEHLWRARHDGSDQVRSFMAGGDVALVHALEGFEDHPAYGARHLEEAGFEDGDLLIGVTEGGETPYVIGATERAARISSNAPFFLYCNEDSILSHLVERFRRVQENPGIRKLCLAVGPMALAGSTRMQASTVLQLAVGAALLHRDVPSLDLLSRFDDSLRGIDLSFLADFIKKESEIYSGGHCVTYRVRDYGITVFTDTTERAPTFSLVPFERSVERDSAYSLCYVSIDDAAGAADAWVRLLNRRPRALDWPEVDVRTTSNYLESFDFSVEARARRRREIPGRLHHEFRIRGSNGGIELRLADLCHTVPAGDLPQLHRHLLLKQMLNIHSTLVMGRLGRYRGNLMTWVRPTNFKLIDRAARYVQHLVASTGQGTPDYSAVVHQLFSEMDGLQDGESVVLKTCRALLRRREAV